ncbi:TerC family protein [Shimazuella sp. AN120528]|uniref:TerC family protein n=1 Tax=Shimazuella soli TaxID=1892854 RepID=UPI001F0DA823|nr:TerC family protein [Shimazuella soli]MCH5585299.1 TerC family protein [Shimazuella soli]
MEILSLEFLSKLLTIVVIDLVLAGDNAIVIGLASRKLPQEQRKKAIFWGTAGAVTLRIIATVSIVWLLKIPGLLLVGGLILVWISYNLLVDNDNHEDVKAGTSFWSALRTIILADTIMSLDNVLAVGGAAHGSILLVVIGLVISVPLVVWGSTLFIKLVDRFPIILYIGSGVLAWTAGGMIAEEPIIHDFIKDFPWIEYAVNIVLIVLVLLAGYLRKQKKENNITHTMGGNG